MLDSTGHRRTLDLTCVACRQNTLKLKTYTPRHGHMGEPLNIGGCIEREGRGDNHHPIPPKSKLFRIEPYEAQKKESKGKDWLFSISEVGLIGSPEIYHYDGYQVPDFGFHIGQVSWVCEKCAYQEKAEEKIYSGVLAKINKEIKYIVWCLFRQKLLVFRNQQIKKLKRAPNRRFLKLDLELIYRDLKQMDPKSEDVKRALAEFKPMVNFFRIDKKIKPFGEWTGHVYPIKVKEAKAA